jgi:hypothetical protein
VGERVCVRESARVRLVPLCVRMFVRVLWYAVCVLWMKAVG